MSYLKALLLGGLLSLLAACEAIEEKEPDAGFYIENGSLYVEIRHLDASDDVSYDAFLTLVMDDGDDGYYIVAIEDGANTLYSNNIYGWEFWNISKTHKIQDIRGDKVLIKVTPDVRGECPRIDSFIVRGYDSSNKKVFEENFGGATPSC